MTEFKTGSVTWKDATSYSQTDKERKPRAWETHVGICHIYITAANRIYTPNWIVTCHVLGIDTRQIDDVPSESFITAAIEAIKICKKQADELSYSFQNL